VKEDFMKDVDSEVKTVIAVQPQVGSYNSSIVGEIIDKRGYESAIFNFITGAQAAAISSAQIQWGLQHSASSLMANLVTATDYVQTIAAATSITAGNVNSKLAVDLKELERYIRVYAVFSLAWSGAGTTPSGYAACTGTLGQARNKPPV